MTQLVKNVFSLLVMTVLLQQTAFAQTHNQAFEAMMMEKWDKASGMYTALTKADNTDQAAWLGLSNALLAKGEKEKAQEALTTGFNAKPDGPLAFICNARILLLQNKPAEADEQFQRAFKKAKKDMVALRSIGESYFFYVAPGDRKPNLTRATQLLKDAIDVNGKDFETLMDAAYAYREQGNGGEAARHFEFASSYNPKSPLPLYMLGTVYKAGRLTDRFLENMDAAIALDNSYTPALRARAEHFYFTRKWEKAKEAYKDLVEKGKEVTIEDEMQYANTLFLTKDYTGCTALVEKIIAKDGSKNYLRRLLGYSYYENGDFAKGQSIMDEYFKIVAPEKIIANDYIYQGRLLLKANKDTTGAISSLRQAMLKDTAEWALNEEIGNLLYVKKDFCGAAGAYQVWIDSLRTEAKSKDIYRLGACYFYCKTDPMRYEHALSQYIRVTEMNPDAPIGWLWAAKSASKLDVTVDSTEASVAAFGKAHPYFEKYVALASTDVEKNKKDLITAYEYIVYYHFVKKEDAQAREDIAKLLGLKPDNETALELLKILDSQKPSGGK